MIQLFRLFFFSILVAGLFACQSSLPKEKTPSKTKNSARVAIARPSLKDITGIKFTEVRRAFDNGLSFHYTGFQLEPEWNLIFTSDSTVKIYSPKKKDYIEYPMYYSHATVFNFAREWLRIKSLNSDSLVFELLEVENKVVLKKPQQVFMTLYSDHYIKKVLNSSIATLRRPTPADTIYVQSKAQKSKKSLNHAFPARNPVIMKSTSPLLLVEKVKAEEDLIRNVETMDAYLLPKYNITINKAYRDFGFYFSVVVDTNGRMHFKRFLQMVDPEFLETKTKVVKGIIDVYLTNLMTVTPGNTLGITHPSVVTLYVSGKQK